MKVKRLTIILLAVALSAVAAAFSVGLVERVITNRGSVKTPVITVLEIGVFNDSECSFPVSEIDWGLLEPSQIVTETVYVKNLGDVELSLSLSKRSWMPSAASAFISLTWDVEGAGLNPGEAVAADLTLVVSSDIQGIDAFGFEIVITGSG